MGNIFAVSRASLDANCLEDTSALQLVLEHYDREQAALVRYLCFLNVNPETAEEIAQDCFLRLHEHLQAGGDSSNLRAWLYRVAHNLARNSQMSARSRKTASLSGVEPHREPVASGQSVEDQLLETEKMQQIRGAMAQLPGIQRQAIVLRAQGLKYREIAEVLGLSTSTVAENIQRGIGALKKLVDGGQMK